MVTMGSEIFEGTSLSKVRAGFLRHLDQGYSLDSSDRGGSFRMPGNDLAEIYKDSKNRRFLEGMEQVSLEVLTTEFSREFDSIDLGSAKVEFMRLHGYEFKEKASLGDFLNDRSFSEALNVLNLCWGLNRDLTQEEAAFFERFKVEFRGSKGVEKRFKYSRTSPEFKEQFEGMVIGTGARQIADEAYTAQFQRLLGALDFIEHAGSPDNGFRNAYGLLESKAREGFMEDAPEMDHNTSPQGHIYNGILMALSQIQKPDELTDFWLEKIRTTPNLLTLSSSLYGLLEQFPEGGKERFEQAATALGIVKGRYSGPTKVPVRGTPFGWGNGVRIPKELSKKEVLEGMALSMVYSLNDMGAADHRTNARTFSITYKPLESGSPNRTIMPA